MTIKERKRVVHLSSLEFFTWNAVLAKRPAGAYIITTVVDWGRINKSIIV